MQVSSRLQMAAGARNDLRKALVELLLLHAGGGARHALARHAGAKAIVDEREQCAKEEAKTKDTDDDQLHGGFFARPLHREPSSAAPMPYRARFAEHLHTACAAHMACSAAAQKEASAARLAQGESLCQREHRKPHDRLQRP